MRSKILLFALAFLFIMPAIAHADFLEGKKSYDNKNWRRAIVLLRPLAEQGDARAMVLLGNMYLDGYGVERDPTEAFMLYRRGAERNNADAMLATATLYQTGNGIPLNTRLAIMWFERCAKTGNQNCAFFYGLHMYQGSKGETFDIKPNHLEAYKWMRLTARGRGNPKMAKAADVIAEKLKADMNYQDVEEADKAIVEWTPTKAEDLGPMPEDIVAAEKENADPELKTEEKPAETKQETQPESKEQPKQ